MVESRVAPRSASGAVGYPRAFGKYALLRPLEDGASGDVFLARSSELGFSELCVLKRLGRAGQLATDQELARARRALPIHHECLVTVLDVGNDGEQVYLAMEYVDGRDLRDVLTTCAARQAALPIEAGLYIGIQLCKGLRELHAAGAMEVLRRVVDPANVLLCFDGTVKLGMARTRDPDRSNGLHREYTGLPYLSPEELAEDSLEPRSDVFSLGMILWDLLVGQPLHTGLIGRQAALEAAQKAFTLRPSEYNPDLDADLDALVMRSLSVSPADRHADVEELRTDLATALVAREPSFDAAGVADLLSQIYGSDVVAKARRESRRLLSDSLGPALAQTIEVGTEQIEAIAAALGDGPAAAEGEDESKDDLAGQLIGSRYRVLKRVGEGGMGAVYLAEHVDIGRQVAIKVLHAAYSNDTELVKRFRQEARAAAEIGHPNIIEVTDFGTTEDGRIFFVMEYLAGEDLAQVMAKRRQLPVARCIHIATQICEALQAAHEAGIVHRDLKPENIFLVERDGKQDFVKILDFGVAINIETVRQGNARLTTPGMAMGTPEYMSPEQAAGQSVDRRVDVYATAVMLFEMLTGRLPHEGPTLMALLNKKATEAPTRPSRYRQDLPGTLEQVILRGLEREPKKRYQTMQELGEGLEEALLWTTGPVRSPAITPSGPLVLPVAQVNGHDPTLLAGGAAPPRPLSASGRHPLDEVITGPNRAPSADPFAATLDTEAVTLERPRRGLWVLLVLLLFGGGAAAAWWMQRNEGGNDQPTAAADAAPARPDQRPRVVKKPKQPAGPIVRPLVKPRKKLTPEEIKLHLEWAKRAAAGQRYTRPKGDNVRDLLARIEHDHPGHGGVKAFRAAQCKHFLRLAKKHLRRRRQALAEKAYEICRSIDPDNVTVRRRLTYLRLSDAKHSYRRRRWQAAVKEAREALKIDPQSAAAYELLGDVAYRRRKYKSAYRFYAQAAAQPGLSARAKRALLRAAQRAKRRAR